MFDGVASKDIKVLHLGASWGPVSGIGLEFKAWDTLCSEGISSMFDVADPMVNKNLFFNVVCLIVSGVGFCFEYSMFVQELLEGPQRCLLG